MAQVGAVVLVTGLAVGIVAVLLSGTAPSSLGGAGSSPALAVSGEEVGLVVIGLFGVYWAYRIVQRLLGRSTNYPVEAVVTVLTVVVVLVALAFFLRYVGAVQLANDHSPKQPQCTEPSCEGTGSGSGQQQQSPPNQTLNSTPPFGYNSGLPTGFPWWVAYLVLGMGVAAVALIAIPVVARRMGEHDEEPGKIPKPSPEAVRSAFVAAVADLEGSSGADPRRAIIRLYGQLLGMMAKRFVDVEPLTAREIEQYCVEYLGVRPENALALTELFEQARYSTQDLGPPTAERATMALKRVILDLSRGASPT
jgi:Na+-transporting methylmalonyl-CoA/oxaloacetate decarboxylase gamma subunit